MNNPIIYIILNGSLNMSAGKAAAQAAHAIAALQKYNGIDDFTIETKRTILVLEAKDKNQIDNLERYLAEMGIPVASYIDEGVNEVDAYSTTALAAGPIDSENKDCRGVFVDFPLYNGPDIKPTFIYEYTKKKWWHFGS